MATRNRIVLELGSVRLREFSESDGIATPICAPYALHGSTIVDFAVDHSLVAALQEAGLERVFVTDWRSASRDTSAKLIDDYLADLNVLVDQPARSTSSGFAKAAGWLVYAARFPPKSASWFLPARRSILPPAPRGFPSWRTRSRWRCSRSSSSSAMVEPGPSCPGALEQDLVGS